MADIVCPFEISSGRLGEPVVISWSFIGSQGNRVGPVINATSGAYWLEKEGNRILHVNISTIGTRRYQCAGQVEICGRHTSCSQSLPDWSRSPTFVVRPTLGRLCLNLYTCVQIFSKCSTMCSCLANYNTFFNIQIVSVSQSPPLMSSWIIWINLKMLPLIVLQPALVIPS